jgi:hypothetical protein
MTREEGDRIDKLTEVVMAVKEEVHTLCATTKLEILHIRQTCDDRHGSSAQKLAELAKSDRTSFGMWERVKGMGVPVAVLIAVLSVVLSVVR